MIVSVSPSGETSYCPLPTRSPPFVAMVSSMCGIRQLRFAIAGTEIPKQRLGLLAQVLEIRMGGQRLRHDASMGPVSA